MTEDKLRGTHARTARNPWPKRSAGVGVIALLLAGAACDDTDTNPDTDTGDSAVSETDAATEHAHHTDAGAGDAGGDAAPHDSANESLFALGAQVLTADAPVTYVLTTDSLSRIPGFEAAEAEIPGRALVFADPRIDALFVGGSAGPELSKYELADAGKLTRVATLSLANAGVTAIGEYQSSVHFVAADKAYYFDGQATQIIVWNPTEMTITDTIALSGLRHEGSVLSFSSVPAVELAADDLLVMPAAYRAADGLSVPSLTAAVIVDTRRDQAEVITDTRCAYARDAVRGPDGLVYLATEVWAAALHRVAPDSAPEPCLLRVDPQQRAYDADFYFPLADLLEGGGTLGSLLALPDGTVLTRVLDESATSIDDATNPRVLAGEPAWGFAELSLGDEPKASQRDDTPLLLGSYLPFYLDGAVYQPHFEMRTRTQLYALDSNAVASAAEPIEGLVFSAVQLAGQSDGEGATDD